MFAGPPPTAAEVRHVFEIVLAANVRGENPPVIPCFSFDIDEVFIALRQVLDAALDPPAGLLEAAREAFLNRSC
jgi:hypothetical protein